MMDAFLEGVVENDQQLGRTARTRIARNQTKSLLNILLCCFFILSSNTGLLLSNNASFASWKAAMFFCVLCWLLVVRLQSPSITDRPKISFCELARSIAQYRYRTRLGRGALGGAADNDGMVVCSCQWHFDSARQRS